MCTALLQTLGHGVIKGARVCTLVQLGERLRGVLAFMQQIATWLTSGNEIAPRMLSTEDCSSPAYSIESA